MQKLNVSIDSVHATSYSLQTYRLLFNAKYSRGSIVDVGAVDILMTSFMVSLAQLFAQSE